ncbi:hypothetical protein NA56DRAFT_662115 [Hyaloscypha hepaticicola]|uniref:GPI anchored protein n=1 Tax=Hyaloscypha hepaticicola TaxID=2082293 RepID=A0A2J6PTW6_9HELO|nr:hypothetical protein NA56DRAFT_662115 [Hyaloscypha hepaticicola]
MLASLFMLAGLCAFVLGSPEPVKRENASASASYSSLLARISSLWEELIPPYSIYTELGGVPATDTGVIGNPSAVEILQSQILESGFPAWFSTLAPDAQSWVLGIAMTAATIIPELASLEVEAGLTTITTSTATATAPASTSASTTSHSSGTMITTTTKATTTSQVITTTQTSSPASPSTSSSKAGAAPTKVIAGFLGAVGFLGLAVAL